MKLHFGSNHSFDHEERIHNIRFQCIVYKQIAIESQINKFFLSIIREFSPERSPSAIPPPP